MLNEAAQEVILGQCLQHAQGLEKELEPLQAVGAFAQVATEVLVWREAAGVGVE